MTKNRIWSGKLPITIIMTVQITMAAIIVVIGVFSVVILLVQQQASATTTITPTASSHNKCSGGDIVTCTHSKKTTHPTKRDSTPFDLPLPFP
jgi:hypothetical protein